MQQSMRVIPATIILLLWAGPLWAQAAPMAQDPARTTVVAVVADTLGNPVPQAEVSIDQTSMRAVTDAGGRAAFAGVPIGRFKLRVRRLGFREVISEIEVTAASFAEIRLVMRPIAAVIDRVIVKDAMGKKPARLAKTTRFDDFYTRRARESGTFLTREDIDKRDPDRTIDLLHSIPGLRVTYRGMVPMVSFARCKNGVQYFIDGQRLNDGLTEITSLHPNQVEAIEIYHGLAAVPPQFIPRPSDCAAVVVWTRYN